MSGERPATSQAVWLMIAIACLFFGSILGYVIATGQHSSSTDAASTSAAAPASSGPVTPTPSLVDEQQVQAYRDILKRDPRNLQAAVQLANMLYDGGRYADAIPAYQQAFALDPRNVNISTDLGTSYWYAGRPDEALAQYEKSLAIDPGHGQTLFNMGIVRRDGKHDPQGAVEAWERLLKTNPDYPDKAKVEQMIASARQAAPAPAAAAPLNPVR